MSVKIERLSNQKEELWVVHLGQFSVGRTAITGSVFGQRQQYKARPVLNCT